MTGDDDRGMPRYFSEKRIAAAQQTEAFQKASARMDAADPGSEEWLRALTDLADALRRVSV
jgi:hypothetical protein